MLQEAVVKCPESLWKDREYENAFWHIAYHTLYFTHLYLQPTREDFSVDQAQRLLPIAEASGAKE
jgi:hypothetical protein